MGKEVFRYTLLFIALVLIQVLICNHIVLFNVAVPVIFIYFIISLPMNIGKGWLFTLSFLLGLTIDIFSDTPGVNALSCTLLAALRRPAFYAYVQRDDKTKIIIPSITTLGPSVYCKYLITLVAVFCLIAFSVEYFSFAGINEIIIMVTSSCLLSFLILLAIDCLITDNKK